MNMEEGKKHVNHCATLGLKPCDCDGYHTFAELYEHRIRLFIELCHQLHQFCWCSKKHSDGSEFEGWFIMGLWEERGKQITYHLPVQHWDEASAFAKVLDKAPEYDGHKSDDVLRRLEAIPGRKN